MLYLIHGPELERTTNGAGFVHELTAAEIDRLDAGSWFSPQFAGERVPRLDEFLPWIKGKAKLFIDVKSADHATLLDLIYQNHFENDCFFWSGDADWLRKLHEIDPKLAIKVNVDSAAEVVKAQERYGASIVETDLEHMDGDLLRACRERHIRLMLYVQQNDPTAYRQVLDWGADIINLNHADVFIRVVEEWMAAHR